MSSRITFPRPKQGLDLRRSTLGLDQCLDVEYPLPLKRSARVFLGHSTLRGRRAQEASTAQRQMFHFGAAESVLGQDEANELLWSLLRIPDDAACCPQPKIRDTVLAGPGLRSELLVLRCSKTSALWLPFSRRLLCAMDMLGRGFGLERRLVFLGCSNECLHYAGNDANYALRALLLLAYHALRPSASSSDDIRVLTYLKALGAQPLPDTARRNAIYIVRASKLTCEDFPTNASDMGHISIWDESDFSFS
ncbi:hypothetical protein MBM_07049 [Drepanopeziza brunnea f. sp. 'multigermtubi' MB_m1]|uniref:Uncharacterized protein n=1 Tax=Marssonina brunnea f. sp. multigermtubi (strain MB_m1) TaxID=1072389 RepID=K1X206_MARBU|nr:uncharacterized protein MBM_07049 [Drepanopeziza brunnea f. sp. 'multigermtubi' MB_m1]EKD14838.1 hypothetical protein MBM_07049 [Drepanopeziza brunnea f. sp. 'multigermtubi' MB_m1]